MAQTFNRYKNMKVECAELVVAGVDVTAAIAEVEAINGLTASAAELNLNDGAVAGTSVASKTLALGADKNTDVLALPVSGLKIGAGAGTAVDRTAAELNLIATGVAAGYKVARVAMSLDGSNPTPWATGLTSVVAAVACLTGAVAPGVSTHVLTTEISGTTVNVHAWKPTSSIDCTLVASTGTEAFAAVAIGT